MSRRRRIYEGKAKTLFEGPEPGTIVQHFKDDATAFNNKKTGTITGKGVINNRISEFLMTKLGEIGVPTHFVRRLNMREQLIRQLEMIPLMIVVRNVAAGSFAKRFGVEEGTQLPRSIMEFFHKNDALGDPMVTEEHITAFGWASPQDLDDIVALTLRLNDFLFGLFLGCGIKLIDFKVEFGRLYEDDMVRIVLADEISPDSAGCGISRPTRRWTRTASATTSARPRRPIRRSRGGSAFSSTRDRATCAVPRRSSRGAMKARVHVTLKNGVLDPQGKAIGHSLNRLGFAEVGDVRQGKFIELELNETDEAKAKAAARRDVQEAARQHGDRELLDRADR